MRRRHYPKTYQAYLVTSGARTTSGSGTGVATPEQAQVVKLDVTARSGTSPQLTLVIEDSVNGSTGWTVQDTFPVVSNTGSVVRPLPGRLNQYVRASWTIAGTTPSFTFSVQLANSDAALL